MKKKKSFRFIIRTYWIHLLFLFFLVNFIVTKTLQLTFVAQSCITREMIASDNRCLYIYANTVYQKGSRNNPHHGHPCGMDVTSILPSSHLGNMARFLDPNIVASLCANTVPTPTTTPQPTNTPNPTNTPRPNPTATPQPTNTLAPQPTNTPQPTTAGNQPTQSTQPTQTPPPTLVPTATRTPTPQPTVGTTQPVAQSGITSTPTPPVEEIAAATLTDETSGGAGFGKFVTGVTNLSEHKESGSTGVLSPPSAPSRSQIWMSIVFWSELLTAGSFILLIVSVLVSGARQIVTHMKFSH